MFAWLFGTARPAPDEELASVRQMLRKKERLIRRERERAQMESEAAAILTKNAAYEGKEQVAKMHATRAVRKEQQVLRLANLEAALDEQKETSLTQETYATIQEATKRQTKAVVRSAASMSNAEFARMNLAYTQGTEILHTRTDEIRTANEAIRDDVAGDETDLDGVDEMMAELMDGKDLEQLGTTVKDTGKGKGKDSSPVIT